VKNWARTCAADRHLFQMNPYDSHRKRGKSHLIGIGICGETSPAATGREL